jgi:hypothetical protein
MSDRQAITVSMGAVSRIQDLENDGPLFETHLSGDEITRMQATSSSTNAMRVSPGVDYNWSISVTLPPPRHMETGCRLKKRSTAGILKGRCMPALESSIPAMN